jgi:hypothetical protein
VLLTLILLFGAGLVYAVGKLGNTEVLVRERCTAVVGQDSYELTPEQTANAALIAAVSVRRGLPARAASIAIATAIQESGLRNIGYGDTAGPDSRGLFQQRPSQGWGSEEEVMDPFYAAGAFYDELVKIPDYQARPITDAAQIVQRSAHPEAYADHEPEGRAFASALTGHSPASVDCVLRKASEPGSPAAVKRAASRAFGQLEPSARQKTVHLRASDTRGWAVAQWAVANAGMLGIERVSFGGLQWERNGDGWSTAETHTGVVAVVVAG